MKYELLYIISQDANDEQKEMLINKFSKMVEDKGGNVLSLEKIGTKKFAYAVNGKHEGYDVLMTFEAKPEVVEEMNKLMNITEHIVRQMFVRK